MYATWTETISWRMRYSPGLRRGGMVTGQVAGVPSHFWKDFWYQDDAARPAEPLSVRPACQIFSR